MEEAYASSRFAASTLEVFALALNMGQRSIGVAFMIGDDANVSDTLGPWEVFQETVIGGTNDHRRPFDLYTVARTLDVVRMSGGLRIEPNYNIADAPQADVIVVPAQGTDRNMLSWLRMASAESEAILSISAGAFQLGHAGLLDGIPATTHHHYWDRFTSEFPCVELRRGPAFVESGKVLTASSRASGRDAALHVVQRYFGEEVAHATAKYIDHDSMDWRSIRRAAGTAARPSSRSYATW